MSYPSLPSLDDVTNPTSSDPNPPNQANEEPDILTNEMREMPDPPLPPPGGLDSQASSGPKSANQANEEPSPSTAQTLEDVKKLIEFYRDPYKWSNLGVEDDGFASDGDDDEASNAEDEKEQRNFLRHSEKMGLIRLLATLPAESTSQDAIEAVRQWAPKGLIIRGRQLLAAIHPDRYQDQGEKEMAQKAFQVIEPALNGDRATSIKGENEDGKVDFLEHYHEEAHIKATDCLIKLYDAYRKGESIERRNPNLADDVKTVYRDLDEINEGIRKNNREIKNAEEFGVIEVDQITNCWKPHNRLAAPTLLWKLCETLHYPMGWASQPPRKDYTYDMDRGESWVEVKSWIGAALKEFWESNLKEAKTTSDLTQHILATRDECNEHIAHVNAVAKRPASLNQVDVVDIMAHYCGLKSFEEASMNAQFENLRRHLKQRLVSQDLPHSWLPDRSKAPDGMGSNSNFQFKQVGGSKAVISTTPRTIEFTMRPGYTYAGERIIALQKVGMFSARFVVEAQDGSRRIVDSGRAGGKLVFKGAQTAGVPCTVTSYEDIREIESAMVNGKTWKVTYVAVSQWDTNRLNIKGQPKLPYVVIGIYILEKEIHVSRSILGKLIGAKAAENIVVQGVGGDVDEGLPETLMSRLPMGDLPKRLADRPSETRGFHSSVGHKADTRDAPQESGIHGVDRQSDDLLRMKSDLESLKTMMSQLLLRVQS